MINKRISSSSSMGNNLNRTTQNGSELRFVEFDNQAFLSIPNVDTLRTFFMSIVSNSDHWMFISSNGGLSAGRRNADHALFPYYTDDKIAEFAEITGAKTIIQVQKDADCLLWEPFATGICGKNHIERNLYKSIYGNSIVFEEINRDIGLSFKYGWYFSHQYGFVKKSSLTNHSDFGININVLDGIQNILPHGVNSDLQRSASNLVDAYKRNELHTPSGIGIYALSAIIVDKAEPSEALKANVAWSIGLDEPKHLLSSLQIKQFKSLNNIQEELDIKGEKGAYFINKQLIISAQSTINWKIVANVNQTQSQIIQLAQEIIQNPKLDEHIKIDISKGTEEFVKLVSAADGICSTADAKMDARHYANVLFNIMRGGIFRSDYHIDKSDFIKYLSNSNKNLFASQSEFIESLDNVFTYRQLREMAEASENDHLIRLATEYLPLRFSRRHGDPSRPWNKFNINLFDEDTGSEILYYEGNWRDIFQNWEALAWSYPDFIIGMIFKFLNASTFDGYNPYRITKEGFDWEVIEPDDPWSYIGYWGDHQIIYLLKFLEIIDKFKPGQLQHLFDKEWFVYAAVPYVIKPFVDIVKNPKDTIEFDRDWDKKIRNIREELGSDGALIRETTEHQIYRVAFIEKILATLLAKMSNFIPEGGIWMNTQRPEWNDANNALVGNGVSMVTLYYLRRFFTFFQSSLEKSTIEQFKISNELIEFYHSVRETLQENKDLLSSKISDIDRKNILDKLGRAASDYRCHIYHNGFWGKKRSISKKGLLRFIKLSMSFLNHTIAANRREDGLYHAYNLMSYSDSGITISHLDEMLEGQVAVLSSGFLSSRESLILLNALRKSTLFRPDQHSYLLYPNKEIPGFLNKNFIVPEDVEKSKLLGQLLAEGDTSIVETDILGGFHFNGNFHNVADLKAALTRLKVKGYRELVEREEEYLLSIFEKVFNHKAFTGRSGTFFAYEGLGSIYWHMVSKLHLAVQECCVNAIHDQEDESTIGGLLGHYYEIQEGIGVHKSPALYGAFPTDPYSHTPLHRGAQQPGMTGQVKEDILIKFSEMGIEVNKGKITFRPVILKKNNFLRQAKEIFFYNIRGEKENLRLEEGELFFSYCQVPIIYRLDDHCEIKAMWEDGSTIRIEGNQLDEEISQLIFQRTGVIKKLHVSVDQSTLI